VTFVKDDQTYAEIPDSELDLLPVQPEFNVAARMAHYRKMAKRCKPISRNLLIVENVLTRLHRNRSVAHTLGHQLTATECDAMVNNWLAKGWPIDAAQMFHEAKNQGGVPWWQVCLNYGLKESADGDRGTVYVPKLPQAGPPDKPPTPEERAATRAAMDAAVAKFNANCASRDKANGKPVRVTVPAA